MNKITINYFEAVAFIIIVILNKIILNIPKAILENTGSSAAINVIYIFLIMLIFTFIICKLLKKFTNQDVIDISELVGGKPLKVFIGLLYFLTFILIATYSLRNFCDTLRIIYFENSPLIYIMLFFIIGSIISNLLRL